MSSIQRREKSPGELAAYRMGLELGYQLNRQPIPVRRRREVHITEDKVVLIEEEHYYIEGGEY